MSKLHQNTSEYLGMVELHGQNGETYTLWIEGALKGIRPTPGHVSTLNLSGGGPGRYGLNSRDAAQAEQRTWTGGRGEELYANDPTRVFDARFAWMGTEFVISQTPLYRYASGIRVSHENMPGSVGWTRMIGNDQYISHAFTIGAADLAADNAWILIRKIGSPTDLTIEIWTDSAGDPNAVVASATDTITAAEFPDGTSEWWRLDLSAAADLTTATVYHIVIRAGADDTPANHWLLGSDVDGAAGKYSEDGATWIAAAYTPYYRVTDADTDRKWRVERMAGADYFISINDAAVASKVYINGDRGIATAGTSTTISDSTKTWTDDKWIGARVRITKGTGKGQSSEITDNDGTSLTFNALSVTPDNTSEYVIYSTGIMTEIETTGLGVVTDVAVLNNVMFFAQGPTVLIRQMQWASGTPGHLFTDDSVNYADFLAPDYESSSGAVIWRGENNDTEVVVSRADAIAYDADFSFGTDINAGNSTFEITNLFSSGGSIYVLKEDELGIIINDRYVPLKMNIKSRINSANGIASTFNSPFLFFNWVENIQRMFGTNVDNIDLKLPSNRRGYPSSMVSHPVGIFSAVDGGSSNYSSVHFIEKTRLTHFELFRSPETGQRIRNIHWQSNEDSNQYFWIDLGGDLVYMKFPKDTISPLRDDSQEFYHEAVIELTTVDYGSVRTPGTFTALDLIAKNLSATNYVEVDYQLDNGVGTTAWKRIDGKISEEFEDALRLGFGGVKMIRLRLRAYAEVSTIPTKIEGTVVRGIKRDPQRTDWQLSVNFGTTADKLMKNSGKVTEFLAFLKDYSENGYLVRVSSRIAEMDEKEYILDLGPKVYTWLDKTKPNGVATIVLRDISG